MQWITARQLDDWSESPVSRTEFPSLIASLIRASAPDVSAFRLPNGGTGDVRGWDGHVVSSVSVSRVPAGDSYWEFKTGKTAYAEGLKEFENRSNATLPADRAQSVYNFVTSRVWNSPTKKPEDWKKEAEDRGYGWKEIRCLDAIAVEGWLDECPAVAARFARFNLGTRPAQGARSTDEFWEDFCGMFDPALVEAVLLADRDERAKELIQALQRGNGSTLLISDSPDEVIAFGVAAIRNATIEVREFLEAHTIIVDEIAAGRELLNTGKGLIFFLGANVAVSAGPFSERGATLVPLGRQQIGGTVQYLNRPTAEAFAAGLVKMNFNPALEGQAALVLAKDCGRSIIALQRLKPSGRAEPPKWMGNAETLLPAILAGAWDANNNKDKAIVAKLAGIADYYAYEKNLRPYGKAEDPPLDHIGNIWSVRAPRDAFLHVGAHIGPEVLAGLRAVMEEVFGDAPPPPDPKAVIRLDRAESDGYSDWLRDGLATTLLQIAVWSTMANMPGLEGSGQRFANDTVAAIPGLGADERVLIALKNQLTYLAEAAPRPLLEALERLLEGNRDGVRRIFDEAEGFLHPVSYHTGLLWALETIAWDPDFFRRAVMLLARLDAMDPGGRLTNRPLNSLGEIFLPWHPSTAADPQLRLSALDQISKAFPQTGWKLIAKMLPTIHGFATGTARPKLREAGSGEISVTYEEFWAMQSEIIQRAVAQAELDPARWHMIVAGITNFAPVDRAGAVKALSDVLPKMSANGRKRIWEDLLKEVEKNERFADAKWALPKEQLAPLRALVDQYAPQDPIEQTRLLFDSWSFDPSGDRGPVEKERRDKLTELFVSRGPAAIAAVAAQVQNSYEVVNTLGQMDLTDEQLEEIATLSLTDEPSGFTIGILATIANRFGTSIAQNWLLNVQKEFHLSVKAMARLLLAFDDSRATWTFARSLGTDIDAAYWSTKGPFALKGNLEELLEAAEIYIQRGRGIAALEACLQRLKEVPTPLIFAILEAVVSEVNAGTNRDGNMISYETQKAFEELSSREDVSIEDIARREIAMFPLLEHSGYKMRIFEVLARNPEVYFDVLKGVFRADDAPEPKEEIDKDETSRWRLNYSILSNFHSLPGYNSQEINDAALTNWVDEVRRLAVEGKRVAITDQYIGHLLAHGPVGADGAWPAEAVRAQLERINSDEMERGLMIERFNMRGAHFRSLYGGGDAEREFAEQFRGYAAKMNRWPRTKQMLLAIARNWEADARREDEWAEQRKIKL